MINLIGEIILLCFCVILIGSFIFIIILAFAYCICFLFDKYNKQNNNKINSSEYIVYDGDHVAIGTFKPLSPNFISSGKIITTSNENKE